MVRILVLVLLGRVVMLERLGTMVSKQSSVNLSAIHKQVTDIQLSSQVQGVPLQGRILNDIQFG